MSDFLEKKLEEYKVKYYKNKLIQGSVFLSIIVLCVCLFLFTLEYFFYFSIATRTVIFFAGVTSLFILLYLLVIRYLLNIYRITSRSLDDQSAAIEIGNYFPEVKDKLLNTLQLKSLNVDESSLVRAGIEQKISELRPIPFTNAVDFRVNFKYLRILALVLLGVAIMGLSIPPIITDGGERIVNFNKSYVPEAPFQFIFVNEKDKAFINEDFVVRLKIEGESVPENAYIKQGGRLIKLKKEDQNNFSHEITNLQKNTEFQFSAAGYVSRKYELEVLPRPNLNGFNVYLDYPNYTRRSSKSLSNVGSFIIPEGTEVTWEIAARDTDSVNLIFGDNIENIRTEHIDNQTFKIKKRVLESTEYEMILSNENSQNKEDLEYKIDVIKDEFPNLQVDFFGDTILYDYVIVSGSVIDDYGISSLKLYYGVDLATESVDIDFNKLQNENSFYFKLDLDTLSLNSNQNFTCYVNAKDNDEINGFKSSKSQVFTFKIPNKESIEESIAAQSKKTESQIEQSISEAESINDKLKRLEDRLKSKKEVEWQEEKLLDDILKQRQEIEKSIEELRKQFEELMDYDSKFNERSQSIIEKSMKLQELMNEILDDETREMYEELQRLLEDKADLEDLRNQLSDLMPNERNMEQELERALELFKRLKVESELENLKNKFLELGEEQENLSEKTTDKASDLDEIEEQQQQIEEKFNELQEKMDQVQEWNQDLKNPEPLGNTDSEEKSIQENLDKIQQDLQNNKRKAGSQNQKNTGGQMKQLGKKLETMKMNMEMEMMTENIENLRHILDDLVKLSFNQEDLIENFRQVTQVDPRFVELSQDQLKLKNDAKVIEDSLLALAQRLEQISAFVTREVGEVNRNIDGALGELKSRNRSKALSNQQFAMASINNLALLLDDLLQQMQSMMANAMGQPSDGQKGNQELPNLKQLQQQLSQQIQELKDSGMKGRQLSQELARMAAEQEMLRNQLQKLKEQIEGQLQGEEIGDNLSKILEQMEENEIDLVNKQLTQELIDRQEEIMIRLLEAEDALREQEFDKEREAESAGSYEDKLPKAFEEYLKAKKKEIELLKSVPIQLNQFYKKEVNDYFRRLSNQY